MLGLGPGEILIIGILLIVFVGPEKLPSVIRWVGRQYGTLKRTASDFNKALILEGDIAESKKSVQEKEKLEENEEPVEVSSTRKKNG